MAYCNYYCNCHCCYTYRKRFNIHCRCQYSPYGYPNMQNPVCGVTYTYDLRHYGCLYPDKVYCCPVYYKQSKNTKVMIPRPLYAVPRVNAEQQPASPPLTPGDTEFHYSMTGRAFETRPCYIYPLTRPRVSPCSAFNVSGRNRNW